MRHTVRVGWDARLRGEVARGEILLQSEGDDAIDEHERKFEHTGSVAEDVSTPSGGVEPRPSGDSCALVPLGRTLTRVAARGKVAGATLGDRGEAPENNLGSASAEPTARAAAEVRPDVCRAELARRVPMSQHMGAGSLLAGIGRWTLSLERGGEPRLQEDDSPSHVFCMTMGLSRLERRIGLLATTATMAVALVASGCGSPANATAGAPQAATAAPAHTAGNNASTAADSGSAHPGADPLETEADAWAWVDFPDSRCANGTATGIAVDRHPSRDAISSSFSKAAARAWTANRAGRTPPP